jgi:hypothetical protein
MDGQMDRFLEHAALPRQHTRADRQTTNRRMDSQEHVALPRQRTRADRQIDGQTDLPEHAALPRRRTRAASPSGCSRSHTAC